MFTTLAVRPSVRPSVRPFIFFDYYILKTNKPILL